MDCSMPGFPVLHYLWEFAQTHILWVGPSCALSPPSPPALNLSQPQSLFKWDGSSQQGGQSSEASASACVLPVNYSVDSIVPNPKETPMNLVPGIRNEPGHLEQIWSSSRCCPLDRARCWEQADPAVPVKEIHPHWESPSYSFLSQSHTDMRWIQTIGLAMERPCNFCRCMKGASTQILLQYLVNLRARSCSGTAWFSAQHLVHNMYLVMSDARTIREEQIKFSSEIALAFCLSWEVYF